MKKKLKALVAMMSLCAVGAVGSAFAAGEWSRTSTTANPGAGNYDQAIYLYWDSGNNTQNVEGISDITTLSGGSTAYEYLTVAPKSTKTVAGTVTISFLLEASDGCQVTGLSIGVYEVDAFPETRNDTTAAEKIDSEDATLKCTITPSDYNKSTTFSVTAGSAKVSPHYYIMAVSYAGGATKLGGRVTISQDFGA